MEMEKSYYVVTFKPAYVELIHKAASLDRAVAVENEAAASGRAVVRITQGGFGQDVVDDERQVKERFLEYLYYSSDLDLPRTAETFDEYFELERADEMIDLDEEI